MEKRLSQNMGILPDRRAFVYLLLSLLAALCSCNSCSRHNESLRPAGVSENGEHTLDINGRIFESLKKNRIDVMLGLLPDTEYLVFLHESAKTSSFPKMIPMQMSEDLRKHNLSYSATEARQTAAKMRKILRNTFRTARMACEKQNLSWERAELKKTGFRSGLAFGKEKPFEIGMKDGYLILHVTSNSRDVKIRIRMIGASKIDSGISIENLSDDELKLLRDLNLWFSRTKNPEFSPDIALRVLLYHKFNKREVSEWVFKSPTTRGEDKWLYKRVGPNNKNIVIHFEKDDRVSAILIDGEPIKSNSK